MTKKVTSYDLWNAWREFNSTGQDQSEGTTSVLSENASGTSSQTLAKKGSSIVAEAGQLAQDLEEIDLGAIRRNPNVKGAYKDVNPVGSARNPVDLPDTESELVGLYNYLLRMGIDKKEAEKTSKNQARRESRNRKTRKQKETRQRGRKDKKEEKARQEIRKAN